MRSTGSMRSGNSATIPVRTLGHAPHPSAPSTLASAQTLADLTVRNPAPDAAAPSVPTGIYREITITREG